VFIPPYSPDLNPIEFIWKSVKRIVSVASINSEGDLKDRIREGFLELSAGLTFARSWNRKFLN
ncbi:MAG: transposase, partial [Thermoplasmatales archaeon]